MGYLILPALLFVLGPMQERADRQLEDFSRLSRAIGKDVALVDRNGVVREGIVEAATADDVTLRLGSATQVFPRAGIASAERLKDSKINGAVTGALVGLFVVALSGQGYSDPPPRHVPWLWVAGFAGAGYVIDAAQGKPLYRAPELPAPTLKVSLRF